MAAFVHGSVTKRSDTARSDIELLALESRFDLAYDAALEIRCILYPFGYNNPMATITATEDFTNWLRKLRDTKAKAVIAERVQRVARDLLGDVEPVGGAISELRIHYGPGYRVYFTRRGEEVVILLCGGDKSSQPRDIKKAQALAAGL